VSGEPPPSADLAHAAGSAPPGRCACADPVPPPRSASDPPRTDHPSSSPRTTPASKRPTRTAPAASPVPAPAVSPAAAPPAGSTTSRPAAAAPAARSVTSPAAARAAHSATSQSAAVAAPVGSSTASRADSPAPAAHPASPVAAPAARSAVAQGSTTASPTGDPTAEPAGGRVPTAAGSAGVASGAGLAAAPAAGAGGSASSPAGSRAVSPAAAPGASPGVAAADGHLPLHRRVRGMLGGWVGTGRRPPAAGGALLPLVSVHVQQHPDADVPTLERAYAVAEEQHRGQRRKSGEPFITHPLAVAMILANLGLDTTTLVAALLHDTIEDTGYSLANTQQDFGLEVAHLVDGVTKLDKVRFGADAEAETLRKMIVAGGRDLRVLVIKLADRLHNMRTLRYQPAHKQQRIARATQDLLVPLADRLGIHVLKRELEGLCFPVLQPAEAETAARLDRERRPHRARLAAAVAAELAPQLRSARIGGRVTERPRHLYSAYRTTRERGGSGAELLDAARVLVLVPDGVPADCYAVLGLVHGRWRPVPGRFKDHIAVPKYNLYQSLHTTVLGPGNEPVDVLIRTESMHRVAEHGVAAHLQAAGRPGAFGGRNMEWLRRLLAWQREIADAGEFFRALRHDLGAGPEVLVFTTAGDAVPMPAGSTPVDLAYALGGSVGHRTIGARVNGGLVRLSSRLADGDLVEILTSDSENPGPSPDWLTSVRTPNAAVRIQQWFVEQSRDVVIERGRHALEVAFAAAGGVSLDGAVEDGSLLVTTLELGHRHLEELYAAVADRRVDPKHVVARSADNAPPA
jgi:guanosine-3',5'-bis(diphosphate) 3'-pyrophosphohydrolase